jgi:uncharacterized protein
MLIGGVLEWVLGNTFPFVVFCSFGEYKLPLWKLGWHGKEK